MSLNTYKKLNNGWGAWIDTGYKGTAITKPVTGDTVQITTKAGEAHNRIVKSIVTDYASGCVVSLVPDDVVAKKAEARYNEVAANNGTEPAPRQAQKSRIQLEREYDDTQNEGYSDSFNPYRDIHGYGAK